MVVPLGPAATAPTLTAAFVIAHSSATPIGTRSPNQPSRYLDRTANALAARLLLRPSVRRRTGDRVASGAMAEVAAHFSVRLPVSQEIPARIAGPVPSFTAVVCLMGTRGI